MGRKSFSGKFRCTWLRSGLCSFLATAAIAAHGYGQAVTSRFPIGNGAIVAAMKQRQLPVSGLQIRMAAAVTSSVREPLLAIRSLSMGDKHSGQALMECRSSSECLPFYVSLAWPVEVDVTGMEKTLPHANDVPREIGGRPYTGDVNSLRAGSPATLLLDGARVHVVLRVVCLESGDLGEKVRVTTPDRRQQYVADVIAPGLLKGSF